MLTNALGIRKRHLNIDVSFDTISRSLTVFVRNIQDYPRGVTKLNFLQKGDKMFLPIFKAGDYDYFIRPHKDSMGKIDYHNCVKYTDDFILDNQQANDHQFLTQEILKELHKYPNYIGCLCVMDVYYQHLFIASPNQGDVHYHMFFHYQKDEFQIYSFKINPIENIKFNIEKFMGIDVFRVYFE